MDDEKELRGGGFPHIAYPAPSSTSLSSYAAVMAIVDNIVCAFHKDTCELGICSLYCSDMPL